MRGGGGAITTFLMQKILVTGGAGFVGANLVRTLQTENPGREIVVVDDFRSGSFANLTSEGLRPFSFGGQVIAESVASEGLLDVLDDFEPDTIFHLASITDTTVTDDALMIRDNVVPFVDLLNYVAETDAKLVWASSAAVYGTRANGATAARRPFTLKDAGHPANVYGFSKWLMENHGRQVMNEYRDAHIVGLRYFNVFGPGEGHKKHMASMIYQLAQQMLAGKRPRIFRDGQQARDHVHVQDVVDATIAGAHRKAKSGIYNVGSGKATTFNQIVGAINEALGTSLEPEYMDNPYRFYQDYTCADLSETEAGLKWQPKRDPVPAMVEYVKELAKLRG